MGDNSELLAFLLKQYRRARELRLPPCERCQREAVQTEVQRELRHRALIRAKIKQQRLREPAESKRGDKRAAVLTILADPASARLSYREISRRAGVSHQYATAIAREICPEAVDREVTVTRAGKTYDQRARGVAKDRTASVNSARPSHINEIIEIRPHAIAANAPGQKPKGNSAKGKTQAGTSTDAAGNACGEESAA
jgi:hypothetical protein